MSAWMLLYYLAWATIDVATFVGILWLTNTQHPERLERLRQKFFPTEAELREMRKGGLIC